MLIAIDCVTKNEAETMYKHHRQEAIGNSTSHKISYSGQ